MSARLLLCSAPLIVTVTARAELLFLCLFLRLSVSISTTVSLSLRRVVLACFQGENPGFQRVSGRFRGFSAHKRAHRRPQPRGRRPGPESSARAAGFGPRREFEPARAQSSGAAPGQEVKPRDREPTVQERDGQAAGRRRRRR